jgi:hypothetical protein
MDDVADGHADDLTRSRLHEQRAVLGEVRGATDEDPVAR